MFRYTIPRGDDQERFSFYLFLIFCQAVVSSMAGAVGVYLSSSKAVTIPRDINLKISSAYVGSMLCSQGSLSYVSFPTQVLGKSSKMIPVMLGGVFFHGKRYKIQQYLAVLSITIGISMFMLGGSVSSKSSHTSLPGVFLLLMSLMFDSIVGPLQEAAIEKYSPSIHQLMLSTNLYGILWCLLGMILQNSLLPALAFIARYPSIAFDLVQLSFLFVLGQLSIFITLKKFGALTLTIITTTRKFFSILASVFFFGHQIYPLQWVGILLVFTGLGWNVFEKYKADKLKLKSNQVADS